MLTTTAEACATPATVNLVPVRGSSHPTMTDRTLACRLALIPPSQSVLTLHSALLLLLHHQWAYLGGTGRASPWCEP